MTEQVLRDPSDGYEAVMTDLLHRLSASRTTLRLDRPSENYPVVAEACAAGVPSIRHDTSIDQRNAATARWILAEGRPLAVEDALTSDPAPPQAIVDVYGLRAFILAPLAKKDDHNLIGWISVHHNGGPRRWGSADLAGVEEALARVREIYFGNNP
jgi:maleate isomerase